MSRKCPFKYSHAQTECPPLLALTSQIFYIAFWFLRVTIEINLTVVSTVILELLVIYKNIKIMTHEVEPWFYSWYRGRVENPHI